MDIYGAFQLCAIGILAGPVTVRISGTYFNAPGRNLIFLWTTVVLAGLISLTVEFFRVTPVSCPADLFVLGGPPPVCNITCDIINGPFSWLRQDAQNNIYVITTPTVFSFGAATLLCAACCVPAVLSLLSMWNKILQQNWKKTFGKDDENEIQDIPISGTNAATPRKMTKVNDNIRFYLRMVEIPIFGVAIIAIIVIGEKNFWDHSVNYQTEPIQSIGKLCREVIPTQANLWISGQWGPIVGTALAAAGSLYAILAAGGNEPETQTPDAGEHHCICRQHPQTSNDDVTSQIEMEQRRNPIDLDIQQDCTLLSQQNTSRTTPSVLSPISDRNLHQSDTNTTSRGIPRKSHDSGRANMTKNPPAPEIGSRHRVARIFEKIGDKIGTPAPGAFDDKMFQRGFASDFPEVPGEAERNPNLQKIKDGYDPVRDAKGFATPLRKQRSQSGSFISVSSANPGSDGGVSEPPSPVAEAASSSRIPIVMTHTRRATLQVPNASFLQNLKPRSLTLSSSDAIPPGPASPTIRVSEPHEEVIEAVQDEEDNGPNTIGGQS